MGGIISSTDWLKINELFILQMFLIHRKIHQGVADGVSVTSAGVGV
jgi:hypothetical protein